MLLLVINARFLELPFPVLAASLVLFARMAGPAAGLLQGAQQAIAMAPAFTAIERRLGPLCEAPLERSSGAVPLDWSHAELKDAAFIHDSGRGLNPVSLALERGSWLGLRGHSASGKTTLVDLIVGLHQPQRGSLEVDGRPLGGERLEQWRAGISYLGQDGLVFSDSVAANLTAGQGPIEDVALWDALEAVGLAGRVRSFADGLHHPLGEGGSSLSGGERQRLLIARAILRRPTLIIFDEATAALDPKAEAAVLSAVRKLPSRPTAVLIAHRDSTLHHCETIIDIQHSGSDASE